jgi:hypothetical protein
MRLRTPSSAAAALLLAAAPLLAQTNPTGTVSGKVLDQQGLAVPGVTVTAESPALQGTRSTNTSVNGDYILPFLPPGDYSLSFELAGFNTVKLGDQRVRPGETATVNATMSLTTITETVTVVGQAAGDFGQGAQVSTSFKTDLVEKLPLNRTMLNAALLAPGVQAAGPNGAVMVNGAMSFESLFVVNGVVVNENLRGQPQQALLIEDALQETTVSTAGISAEFGRFQGGVVQAITKSGGNQLSGSYRVTLDNDDWTALTPYPNDSRTDKLLLTHEATLGGPFIKDKLWFFTAGRLTKRETTIPTSITALNYQNIRDQQRYEGKLTWALDQNHTFKGAYTKVVDKEDGNSFGAIMDTASLVTRETPQELLSANYTGIISPKFFVEGQYSRRRFTFVGSGSRFTDPIRGTLMVDQSRGTRFWSPTFCGVCDDERRDNQNLIAKATYFASTDSLGSHSVVVGFDMFDDKRLANNHQSGSDYRILATTTIVRGSDVFPVLDNRSIIQWNPILVSSLGNRFRTISAFVNDTWNLNRNFTFNLGLRYDKNDGTDQAGTKVVKDDALSPRLSVTWDPRANGEWTVNASFAQYVAAIANSIGDGASPGGNPATFQYDYLGPAINTGNPASPIPTDQALQVLWNWFNANGGTNRATRTAPTVPGVNTRISDRLKSPNSREVTFGVGRRLGSRGAVRADGVYRTFRDFYIQRVDRSTGQVSDQFGRRFDMRVNENSDDLERTYRGVNLQASYRVDDRLTLGGNYTLGELTGNVEGETGPSGPVNSGIRFYPEYFDSAWTFPVGHLLGDVRHRARAWATWELPLPDTVGRFNLGALQFFSSGTPYSAAGPVDTRPFVTNPGYATPPGTVTYFFSERGAFETADLWRTDLALNWSRRLGVRKAEVFFRGTVLNVFGRDELTNFFDVFCGTGGCIDNTVQTNANLASLTRFNPFTETPVEGVHWRKGPNFGQPLSRFAYQTPRTYQFSMGVRF